MPETSRVPLSQDELLAEVGVPLPDKQVITLLDLNVDLDLMLDLASPIDLAIGGNANVAAPIDAAVGANVLSSGSTAEALADQGVQITHSVVGNATAIGDQDGTIDQADGAGADGTASDGTSAVAAGAGSGAGAGAGVAHPAADTAGGSAAGSTAGSTAAGSGSVDAADLSDATDVAGALNGGLLNLNVDVAADLDAAAPIAGAVALNANVAAPIDAALSANVGSDLSQAAAVAQQDAIITQTIEGDATASAVQDSKIDQ